MVQTSLALRASGSKKPRGSGGFDGASRRPHGLGRQRFCCCGARPSAGRGSSGRHAALRDDAKRDVGAALKDAQRDDGAVRSTPIRSDRASITRKFKTLLVSAERFPSTGRDVGVARRRRSSRGRSRDLPESPIPQSGTSARLVPRAAAPRAPARRPHTRSAP